MLDEERRDLIDEACGVFATIDHPEASNITYLGLHALQHRGQESAGIAAGEGDVHRVRRCTGLISDGFTTQMLRELPGRAAIGHVRYSTTGESSLRNAQPLTVETRYGPLALAHNGNLTNADALRAMLVKRGSIFQTTTDTEVIAHLVARSEAETFEDAIIDALTQVQGAFSLVALTHTFLVAVRDKFGVRPLVLGRLGQTVLVSSEPVSFPLVEATCDRAIEPGEMFIRYDDGSERWLRPFDEVEPRPCIFELVYFSRPDNEIFGRDVYQARKEMGRILARESAVQADIVIPVPDSGVPAALGYSEESGIQFELGLVRSHYVGRTFIEPTSSIRDFGVKLKLSPIPTLLRGREVVVVDDSIVRGTTCRKIIAMLRNAGASKVHFRVASPPTTNPCFYGIDTPRKEQLIAANHGLEEIRSFIGADSLAYLSLAGLRSAVGAPTAKATYCEACFTGEYPIELVDFDRN